jgi:EmrB/QacA subfamily drug resistance transporter
LTGLRKIEAEHLGEQLQELFAETDFVDEPRGLDEIQEAESELFDRIWYQRSINHLARLEDAGDQDAVDNLLGIARRRPVFVGTGVCPGMDGTGRAERPRLTHEQGWALVLSSVASFMVVLDMLVVATSLTAIQRDLDASLQDLEWTVNAYTLSFAVLLMTGAALGDRYGRRRTFAAGLGVFAVASAACALSPNTGTLIGARAVQGVGAAMIMPLALALLNGAFPQQRRGWATGIYAGISALAVTLGPVLGGAITQGISWPWIFWLNVPIGLIAIPFVLRRMPESHVPGGAVDRLGILLAALAALGVMWGLVRANSVGWASSEALSALAGGTLLGAAFVAWELRSRNPMLPMRMFSSRAFSAGNVSIFLLNATVSGAIFFTAQYYQVALGQGPLETGLRLLPWGVMPLLLASLAGTLTDRLGERPLAMAGMLLIVIGMGWISLVAGTDTGYRELVVPMTLGGIGFALGFPAVTKAGVSSVPPQDISRASGAFSTNRQLGGAFGVAILGTVFAATGGYASPRVFVDGFTPALGICAVLALMGGVAATLLPGRRRPTHPAAAPQTTRPAATKVS